MAPLEAIGAIIMTSGGATYSYPYYSYVFFLITISLFYCKIYVIKYFFFQSHALFKRCIVQRFEHI